MTRPSGRASASATSRARATLAADLPVVTEGAGTVAFTIWRVGNLGSQAVVNWATGGGTATPGSDYLAASGQVDFQVGEAEKTVTVTVLGDGVPEAEETLQLQLSTTAPGYAAGMGQAAIADDDIGVSVGPATAIEGDITNRLLGALVPTGYGGLTNPYAMIKGLDGLLYVTDLSGGRVLRYDPATWAAVPAPGKPRRGVRLRRQRRAAVRPRPDLRPGR